MPFSRRKLLDGGQFVHISIAGDSVQLEVNGLTRIEAANILFNAIGTLMGEDEENDQSEEINGILQSIPGYKVGGHDF